MQGFSTLLILLIQFLMLWWTLNHKTISLLLHSLFITVMNCNLSICRISYMQLLWKGHSISERGHDLQVEDHYSSFSQADIKLTRTWIYVYNANTWDGNAERLEVQVDLLLQNKLEASLSYIRPCPPKYMLKKCHKAFTGIQGLTNLQPPLSCGHLEHRKNMSCKLIFPYCYKLLWYFKEQEPNSLVGFQVPRLPACNRVAWVYAVGVSELCHACISADQSPCVPVISFSRALAMPVTNWLCYANRLCP